MFMPRFWLSWFAIVTTAVAGCAPSRLIVPASDPTPPSAIWLQIDRPGQPLLNARITSADPPVIAAAGQQMQITARADDPDGGVKDVQIWIDAETTTFNPNGSPVITPPVPSTAPVASTSSQAAVGDPAPASSSVTHSLTPAVMTTPQTRRFVIRARAVNFHGGAVVTQSLVVTVPSSVAPPSPGRVCGRSGGAPVITLDSSLAAVGQRPGRQHIGYALQSGDGVEIIVDDAPGLARTQMLVEVDLDPVGGVTKSKRIEAWAFCQGSFVNAVAAGGAGGIGVGVVCNPLTPANDFRSGCTTFTAPMLITQANTDELWLRREPTPGVWNTAEGIDQSIWPVFGGRRVRFIWLFPRD
ncbi:MAG: hypothetical protein MPW16_15360 [Candidatus Manganitrophus sp.]|nr:MAG: hypothetical protein MPW16_15360 [Candidatus Manganitrophus sp.]